MGIGAVIFKPVSPTADVKILIAMMFDEVLSYESAVLKAAGVLLQGLLKVDSDKFPFFTSLTSFLRVRYEVQLVFRSNQVCYDCRFCSYQIR